MVAVLKRFGGLLIAAGALLVGGCHGSDDANAPVANPPGRVADPSKYSDHPAPKKLVPLGGGMHANPNAQPITPGTKLKSTGP